MSFVDLLPTLRALPRAEKLQAIQFLATQLAQEEDEVLGILKPGATYSVWSPYDSHEAAAVIRDMLEAEKSSP